MISISRAMQRIEEHVLPTKTVVSLNVADALGFVLSEPVNSPINMPPFRQSAMDGYALHLHDSETYEVTGEVKAGDAHQPNLQRGQALRIFTGAAVPDSANAVIMQEKTTAGNGTIQITETPISEENIRPLGEQVKKGAVALEKGTVLRPAAIGFLTSLGITQVKVFQKPTIAIITTGNELVAAGQPLSHGQLYESNSTMLSTALKDLGYNHFTVYKVEDNYEKTNTLLQTAIKENKVVLITGGISVGDYDFVGPALKALQVEELFYKVNQKPGKPFYFGKKAGTFIFALPGNPAASLSCFYVYVQMALRRISGDLNFQLKKTKERSASSFVKKGGRPQFLKAIFENNEVRILEGQSSAMLQTFALANAVVFLDEDVVEIAPNDMVDVIHLPN